MNKARNAAPPKRRYRTAEAPALLVACSLALAALKL